MLRRISLRRLPFMVGLLFGVSASLLLVSPLSCDVDADVSIRPIINLQTRDTETNKQYSAVIRPRLEMCRDSAGEFTMGDRDAMITKNG